ncbi:MAG: hypothetical protein ABIN67_03135 [Ferruginibacter sp.]
MAATKIKFSPSINILRDSDYEFNYILTPNASDTFSGILNAVLTGTKAHVIIGAYGTGKSSFLLAFKQTFEKSYIHFKDHSKLLNSVPNYEFVSIVGEYASLEEILAKRYQLGKSYTSNDVIKAIDKEYKSLKKKGVGFAFLVDEFGKFLDYAAKNNPESELYFIQLFSEWVNDANTDALFIATLHQDFSTYALHLNKAQRQEWDKVRGRLNDIPFNEPVEQLLFLAAERIDQKFQQKKIDKNFDRLFEAIRVAKAFPLRDYFDKDLAKKLYPFDILSAALLTLSLQRYGQNERSLFSFIESNDHLGINAFEQKENTYYAATQVYDYLIHNYYGVLSTNANSNYQQWSNIRTSLEKIDGLFNTPEMQADAEAIIKTIGLLNIFSNASAKLEPQFYISYAKLALGIKDPEEILRILNSKLIIRYVRHNFRYTFVGSTDLDIDLAIDDAGKLIEKVSNVVHHLNQYFEFPFIAAKSVFYEKGTPRFFQFKLTEEPINQIPEGEVDGFINLIFSEDPKVLKRIEQISIEGQEATIYAYFKNTAEIRSTVFEIQKVEKVKETNREDKIALRELDNIKEHYIRLLNHYVLDSLYSNNGNVLWYARGKKLLIRNRHKFNQELSKLCNDVYSATPIYKNELVNKTRISGQVSTARKRFLEKVLADLDKPNIGFTTSEFPPEKSIYLTLLRETGIHQILDGVGVLQTPTDTSFADLWKAGEQFLESSKNKERSLVDFIATLSAKPFKLKQGVIDYWVPIFLLAKQNEFALYEGDTYVPEISANILDLMNKKPGMFAVKAFDVIGIRLELFNRYRIFLNQTENHKPTNKTFIQTIKPFLVFYRDLPEYSRKTNRLDKKTINLRKVIATAKDPEKAFFEDFPAALGYSITELQNTAKATEKFLKQLQEAIKELRGSYDGLLDRFETYLLKEIIGGKETFPAYKNEIRNRFKQLKTHLLLPHQKTFYSRIQSELDDRKAWLSSIAQACIGKSLNTITDEDEIILFEKLKDIFYELDNLSDISKEQINDETEEVVKLEITSFVQGLNKNLLRIPKAKTKEVDAVVNKLKTNLGKDKKMNIAALTKLLQQLLNND